MPADDPRFPAPEHPPKRTQELLAEAEKEEFEKDMANLRDHFAIGIAPTVVEALSPKGYGQKEWAPAKVIGNTVYAIADALIEARNRRK